MRRMHVLRGAVLSVAVMLLASCSGGDGGSGDSGGDVATVTVWDRAGAQATTRQAFFEEWNDNEGRDMGIRVSYEPQATEKYEELVRLGFQTQRAPDLFHGPSSQMGAFVAAGWVQPIEDLVDPGVLEAAEASIQDDSELVWDGVAYAIPTTSFTIRLVINRGLFEQAGLDPDSPPTTFSEVEEAARAITASSGGKAYGIGLPVSWVGFRQWIVDTPMLAADENLAQNGLFNRKTGQYESTKYAPVVSHYRTLIEEGLAYPGAANLDFDTEVAAFANGEIGMMLQSSSVAGVFQQLGTEVDVGVGLMPVPDGSELVRSPMNAGFPYSISSTTENPEAAAKVFEVLVGPAMQEALAAGGTPPLTDSVFDSAAAKENQTLQLFRPQELDQQWPKTPGGVLTVEGENVNQTIAKLILDPSTDIDSELAALEARYQAAWDAAVKDESINPDEFTG